MKLQHCTPEGVLHPATRMLTLDPPNDFIRSLPKAELHLHLEGTVGPATLSELSCRHPTPLSTANNRYTNIADSGRVFTEDEARALYNYTNFTGFLLAFKAVTERLRTADDYELVAYRMMQKLAEQNVLSCRGLYLCRRGALARRRLPSPLRRLGTRTRTWTT